MNAQLNVALLKAVNQQIARIALKMIEKNNPTAPELQNAIVLRIEKKTSG